MQSGNPTATKATLYHFLIDREANILHSHHVLFAVEVIFFEFSEEQDGLFEDLSDMIADGGGQPQSERHIFAFEQCAIRCVAIFVDSGESDVFDTDVWSWILRAAGFEFIEFVEDVFRDIVWDECFDKFFGFDFDFTVELEEGAFGESFFDFGKVFDGAGESGGGFMTAVSHHKIGGVVESGYGVDARRRPDTAAYESAFDRSDGDGFMKNFSEASCDDAGNTSHPRVAFRVGNAQKRRCIFFEAFFCLFQHERLNGFSGVIHHGELVGEPLGFDAVCGVEEFDDEGSGGHASGGIDDGTEIEGDFSGIHAAGLNARRVEQGFDAGVIGLVVVECIQSGCDDGTIFEGTQGDDVGDGSQSREFAQTLDILRIFGEIFEECLGEFQRHAACGEMGVWIGTTELWWADDGESRRGNAGAFGDMVIEDDDVDTVRLSESDGGFVAHADISGHDEGDVVVDGFLSCLHGKAVAFDFAVGDMIADGLMTSQAQGCL